MKNGAIVIDSRIDLQGSAIKDAYLITEKGTLASWVGTHFPVDSKIVIFCNADRREDMIERLLRVGYFNILGVNDFSMEDWKSKEFEWFAPKAVKVTAFKDLKDYTIVDVRKPPEWKKTGIAEGAKLIPLPELENRWE